MCAEFRGGGRRFGFPLNTPLCVTVRLSVPHDNCDTRNSNGFYRIHSLHGRPVAMRSRGCTGCMCIPGREKKTILGRNL